MDAATRWSGIVRNWDASGLALGEFARKQGVKASTLSWWRWKLQQTPKRNELSFVEVDVGQVAPRAAAIVPMRLRMEGRPWILEVPSTIAPDVLRDLVESLC
jgi:hypothetical protein